MKRVHRILFVAAALWISPLLLWYLALVLSMVGIANSSLDPLVLPGIYVAGTLDMLRAPSFLTTSGHGVSFLTRTGELIVFGLPFCVLVGFGMFLRARTK